MFVFERTHSMQNNRASWEPVSWILGEGGLGGGGRYGWPLMLEKQKGLYDVNMLFTSSLICFCCGFLESGLLHYRRVSTLASWHPLGCRCGSATQSLGPRIASLGLTGEAIVARQQVPMIQLQTTHIGSLCPLWWYGAATPSLSLCHSLLSTILIISITSGEWSTKIAFGAR